MKLLAKVLIPAICVAVFSFSPEVAYPDEPAIVQLPDENSNVSCGDAIAAVEADLARREYFIPWDPPITSKITPAVKIDKTVIQENYYDYPSERTETVIFKLSGDLNKLYQGLMSSPKFMATLSAQIMAECDQVGLVEFAHWWEGYVPVGYFPDNTARTFTWTDDHESIAHQRKIETPNGQRLLWQWGYYFSP